MKYINLFLASSIVEFEAQRKELGDYIRSLNDIYVRRGIYFDLTICEDLSTAVAKERKQAEYNAKILDSQYFFVLFGKAAGEYTVEEFNVALESFRERGAPQIYTYFMELPQGESPEVSVTNFMQRLDQEIGHYYSTFSHLDSIKLHLLLELTRDKTLHSQVKFEDGQAIVDGNSLLVLGNIPVYSKNEMVQRLMAEKTKLDEEFSVLTVEFAATRSRELLSRLSELGARRKEVTEQLHQLEMSVLNIYNDTAEKRSLGQALNWREKKALELLDQGDYEGAMTILRDKQWDEELRNTEELERAAAKKSRTDIPGVYLRQKDTDRHLEGLRH